MKFVENGFDMEKFLRAIAELLPWLEGQRSFCIGT